MGILTKLINNKGAVLNELDTAIVAALEAIGKQAETNAKQNVTENVPRKNSWSGSNGTLRNSIGHKVILSEDAVYIGSNLDYAVYNELGTGIYADGGSTGSGWWVYVAGGTASDERHGKRYDEATARKIVAILRSKDLDAHMTQGMKPIHFLRDAVQNHGAEYKAIAENELKKG